MVSIETIKVQGKKISTIPKIQLSCTMKKNDSPSFSISYINSSPVQNVNPPHSNSETHQRSEFAENSIK